MKNVWDRRLWGVHYIGMDGHRILIGSLWHSRPATKAYEGEPTRALLFQTRQDARDWCRNKARTATGLTCRFVPVSVRETVR